MHALSYLQRGYTVLQVLLHWGYVYVGFRYTVKPCFFSSWTLLRTLLGMRVSWPDVVCQHNGVMRVITWGNKFNERTRVWFLWLPVLQANADFTQKGGARSQHRTVASFTLYVCLCLFLSVKRKQSRPLFVNEFGQFQKKQKKHCTIRRKYEKNVPSSRQYTLQAYFKGNGRRGDSELRGWHCDMPYGQLESTPTYGCGQCCRPADNCAQQT